MKTILNTINPDSFFAAQVQMYENLYNQELENRRNLDNKIISRLTIVSAEFSVIGIIKCILEKQAFFSNSIEKYLLFLNLFLMFVQIGCFYRVFFRIKKKYKEVSPEEIRMFHLSYSQEKLVYERKIRYQVLSSNQIELITYLVDSYQYCTFNNTNINLKRATALDVFDNITIISVLLIIVECIIICLKGGALI